MALIENQSVEVQRDPVLVKCGGFSTQLANNVSEQVDGDPLWGSRFDAKNPTAVIKTHLDFLQNGAQIILSNTYQSSVEGFKQYLGLTEDESIQLIRKSVKLANNARDIHRKMVEEANGSIEIGLPLVLASIGPYGAHLHDGSEYSGSYADHISKEELQKWHRIRIDACLAEGVDGLAIETIPCQKEAEAVVEMLLQDYPDVRFWVSFQCKDNTSLAHGEKFADAVLSIYGMVKQHNAEKNLIAIGTNCVHPNHVTPLLLSLHAAARGHKIPLVVYSNRGEIFNADEGIWTGEDKCIPVEAYVPEWIDLGVKIVGGCCRVYPADILQIRKCVDNMCNNN